jgi:cytochrome P450/NADPH-cytochrome P450 reductase
MENMTICPPEKKRLQALLNDDENGYLKYVYEAKRSIVDLLEEFPASEISFAAFIGILAPLKIRYYSISSSPLILPNSCSITVSILDVPAKKGDGNYLGVCSNYLAGVKVGKEIQAVLKDPGDQFRLPINLLTPIIMIGPGTGFAPFRGFLQERNALLNQGKQLGKSLLLYGCRNSSYDYIYKEELKDFENNGVTKIIPAFSRENESRKEYVQHKIMEFQDEIWDMLQNGAIIYVCGDGKKMEPDVNHAFKELIQNKTGKTLEESTHWMEELKDKGRYVKDVWASN